MHGQAATLQDACEREEADTEQDGFVYPPRAQIEDKDRGMDTEEPMDHTFQWISAIQSGCIIVSFAFYTSLALSRDVREEKYRNNIDCVLQTMESMTVDAITVLFVLAGFSDSHRRWNDGLKWPEIAYSVNAEMYPHIALVNTLLMPFGMAVDGLWSSPMTWVINLSSILYLPPFLELRQDSRYRLFNESTAILMTLLLCRTAYPLASTLVTSLNTINETQQGLGICPNEAVYQRGTSTVTGQRSDRTDLTGNRQIISGTVDSTGATTVYADGSAGTASVLPSLVSTSDGYIEIGSLFEGYIQELIVLGTAVTTTQREAIHRYLSKKWHVSPHRMDSNGDGTSDYWDPSGVPPCSVCSAGSSSALGACQACQAGKYSPYGGRCDWCPGNSTSYPGAVSIAQCSCVPGYYRTSLTTCEACPAGFYCPAVWVPSRPFKTQGVVWERMRAWITLVFALGLLPTGGDCSLCVVGYYDDGNGVCVPCPLHTTTSVLGAKGSTACDMCATGYYNPMMDYRGPLVQIIRDKPPWGVYLARDYNNGQIPDAQGVRAAATVTGGTISHGNASGNGANGPVSYVSGDSSTSILFPSGSIPDTFTICGVARETNVNPVNNFGLGLIFVGMNNPWFLGWYYSLGRAYFGKDMTDNTNKYKNYMDWMVVCGTNGGVHPNNIKTAMLSATGYTISNYGTADGGSGGDTLAINAGSFFPPTGSELLEPFSFHSVYIWNQTLTSGEMDSVMKYLLYILDVGESDLKCDTCDFGFYNADGICVPCPSGLSTSQRNSTLSDCHCPVGHYLDSNGYCWKCPWDFTTETSNADNVTYCLRRYTSTSTSYQVTFDVDARMDVLIVGGGGAGGYFNSPVYISMWSIYWTYGVGGGGAGGMGIGWLLLKSNVVYQITIGDGGKSQAFSSGTGTGLDSGLSGGDTTIIGGDIDEIAYGGGGGGGLDSRASWTDTQISQTVKGKDGGSSGGSANSKKYNNVPVVSYVSPAATATKGSSRLTTRLGAMTYYGNNGGVSATDEGSSGGGGASEPGEDATSSNPTGRAGGKGMQWLDAVT
ncbi:hypothetical protein GUITHDRAFT_146006 [Guillardia theta CCMP2712]|uniref:Tyrosine-protein kinase ephrin type A/B receptor-like domain-containing protein n=1 Tax=Guillardia theta (strain CCMP2712) TaxID=905079 RepID=L1IJB2_GUITC|nr:hypothetical protein GUITHDRAFT_146006 [Guillardia theta CCMP2712]EKX36202.1 hypothetical protein GUITHDRAFT_146006 [Guillardia theta CCMP2712]|eukprot:XP_005823182.1 hypothetical protein GUITHDRAFT_146006 [Guillardia theta CCMP2712]